jgi:hypothetical protein
MISRRASLATPQMSITRMNAWMNGTSIAIGPSYLRSAGKAVRQATIMSR